MAFTAPVTRATDFLVTAAIWNAEHVDNFNTAVMHLVARKSSDQSVTSSTVLVDDTALQLTVGVSEVWLVTFYLLHEGGTTGDIKVSFSFPSGRFDARTVATSQASVLTDFSWAMTTSDTPTKSFLGNGAGSPFLTVINGIYTGGGSGGTLKLRWAQDASDAVATKVLINSLLFGVKLA